jgi:hypothetical protein
VSTCWESWLYDKLLKGSLPSTLRGHTYLDFCYFKSRPIIKLMGVTRTTCVRLSIMNVEKCVETDFFLLHYPVHSNVWSSGAPCKICQDLMEPFFPVWSFVGYPGKRVEYLVRFHKLKLRSAAISLTMIISAPHQHALSHVSSVVECVLMTSICTGYLLRLFTYAGK